MAYWLIKSEPGDWSWQDQCAVESEPWTGVRNYQARNNLKSMALDDLVFFYHSVSEKQIVGIVRVVREAYPDPTDTTGKWMCPDVTAVDRLPTPVTFARIKAAPELATCALLKQSRLSVVPITPTEWHHICSLGEYAP